MVTKSILNMLDMTCIEDYFECIVDSKNDRRNEQAKDLYTVLSSGQQEDFFEWVEATYYYEADNIREYTTEMQNFKNYFL